MRTSLIVLLLSLYQLSFAQLREGFDPDEAKALIAICNSYTFQEIYGDDAKILPYGYEKVFTSQIIGLDNMFQVYVNGQVGVINFRGSTPKTSSWLENMYSAMIPAKGVIKVNNRNFPYEFASDTAAAVHSGYALATVLLSRSVIEQINSLNGRGIFDVLLIGHSQGGALASLCRAYLENLPNNEVSSKNRYKTYAFANPMCGNLKFSEEYNTRFCEINMSYSVINPADLVPQMPMHYQEEGKVFSAMRFKNWVYGIEPLDMKKITHLTIRAFEPLLKSYIKSSNELIERLISANYVAIEMPAYVSDINYHKVGAIRKLEPFPYPNVPVDTTGMTKKVIAKLDRADDGKYYDKEPSFFQHKPYNYYVSFLKEYFSWEYRKLELLYLPEKLE